MATPSAYTIAREVLSADLTLPNDAVIARLKDRGVKGADTALRLAVNSVRKKLRKKATPPASKPVLAAARQTSTAPKVASAKPTPAPVAVAEPAPVPSTGVTAVLSNVALVNAAVAACGGVEQARQVADAVKACGGPDGFAQYLDLVAGIRTTGA